MIKISPKGKWRQANLLLQNYEKRVKYSLDILIFESANKLLEEIYKRIPKGSDYDDYRKSLKVVKIGQADNHTYAVVSEREAVKLGDIKKQGKEFSIVVYITASGGTVGKSAILADYVSQNEVWPIDLIPNGIKKGSVVMVHRRVLKSEEKHIRAQTKEFVKTNRKILEDAGASWGAVEPDIEKSKWNMSSMPDYMVMALRAEFGINDRARPHWRPSIKGMRKLMQRIIDNDQRIQGALYNYQFTEHMKSFKIAPMWGVRRFSREANAFQKALVG